MVRGKGWTDPEVHRMLDLAEYSLPLGSNDWERVQSEYHQDLPAGWGKRDVDTIKRKFKALRNIRKPTGDPDCPETVKRAIV